MLGELQGKGGNIEGGRGSRFWAGIVAVQSGQSSPGLPPRQGEDCWAHKVPSGLGYT